MLFFICLGTETLSRGNFRCYRKIRISKKFMHKLVISRSVEKFLSQSAKRFRLGTLLCVRRFLVSDGFMDDRDGRDGRRRE